MTASENTLQGY